MRSASGLWQRPSILGSGFRPIAMIALAAPLALSACNAQNPAMKTAALAQKPQTTPSNGPDAYGYAPVRLATLSDGAEIALPSNKPDYAKLQAADAAKAVAPQAATASDRAPALTPAAPATGAAAAKADPAAPPVDPAVAALAADVAERKAQILAMGEGKGERLAVAAPAPAAPVEKPLVAKATTAIASAADALDPTKTVPAAVSAVAHSAEAVKVAAIDTTSRAVDAVRTRLGDTFKGEDTVTGSQAMDRMIEEAAADNNIPTELAYAVVRVESHYNPTAIGGGAYGLSQIKPATARGLGFAGPSKALLEPETNLRYGMKYLAGAWEKSGHDICGTAMRYKGGHRTTVMSRSAAVYCANVKRHMAAIERRRGAANSETQTAAAQRTRQIEIASAQGSVASVAKAAGTPAGRLIAASAVPVPADRALPGVRPDVSKANRVRQADDAGISNVAFDGRFGYAN